MQLSDVCVKCSIIFGLRIAVFYGVSFAWDDRLLRTISHHSSFRQCSQVRFALTVALDPKFEYLYSDAM